MTSNIVCFAGCFVGLSPSFGNHECTYACVSQSFLWKGNKNRFVTIILSRKNITLNTKNNSSIHCSYNNIWCMYLLLAMDIINHVLCILTCRDLIIDAVLDNWFCTNYLWLWLLSSFCFAGIKSWTSQPKNTHKSLYVTETILADLNRYTTAMRLAII